MQPVIFIVIATALHRTDWLLQRSLPSVYKQQGIEADRVKVMVIDDNRNEAEFSKIQNGIILLRNEMRLSESQFPTRVFRNQRTHFMSGTGAWNTGILKAYEENPESFVAILDDDDEYLAQHLVDCIKEVDDNSVAVFQSLYWANDDGTQMSFPLNLKDITPENFFIGNPGIQGSNMFFKVKHLVAINGFDENLPNTTDRDLMIRFLWHIEQSGQAHYIKVIEKTGVIHYNHKKEKVNNQPDRKRIGLDLFYTKYRDFFSGESYQKSLIRANHLFHYLPIEER